MSLLLRLISLNKMASASNFRTSLRRHNVIYTRATFSRTKASAKWSVTATTLSRVTSRIQNRAQFRLFQVKAMFKQHVNLMIWTWILRLQTASRNEFPCKNFCLLLLPLWESVIVLRFVVRYFMSILVLQSSWWGRESWLLCLICLPGVSWRLSGSSSRCHGVVCSLWLWYFLIILTYYLWSGRQLKPALTSSLRWLQK